MTFTRREFQLGALATLMSTGLARAETWPTQAVRVVIPFAPGGSTDALTRPVLDRLHEKLGQPFVIENRPGAGSVLGTGAVARSAPNGYTLLVNTSSYATSLVVSKTDYSLDSFDSIGILATSAFAAFVSTNSPIKSIKDLVEAARQKNGNLIYATAGIGSSTHFVTEYFCMRASIRMKHVPYSGIGPAMIGILTGECDLLITTPASGASQVQGGQVRVLAYTSDAVPTGYPNAPSIKESGIDCEANGWYVMLAPRGTPDDVLQKLNLAVNEILKTPAIEKIYDGLGAKPAPMGRRETTALLAKDKALWAEVAQFADIKVQ